MSEFKKTQPLSIHGSYGRREAEHNIVEVVSEVTKEKKAKQVRVSLEMPDYVRKQLKDIAHQDDVSVKYVVLKILADAGVHVHAVDLIKDGRRER